MKRIVLIAVLAAAILSLARSQVIATPGRNTGNFEQEVIQAEQEFLDAYLRADIATLEQFLIEDYTQTDIFGRVQDRAAWLRFVAGRAAGGVKLVSQNTDDFKVRLYGKTAVLTARWTGTAQVEGQERTQQLRFTSVWVQQRGRWMKVAYHASVIRQQ